MPRQGPRGLPRRLRGPSDPRHQTSRGARQTRGHSDKLPPPVFGAFRIDRGLFLAALPTGAPRNGAPLERAHKYYDLVLGGFVAVLLCSNLIGAGKTVLLNALRSAAVFSTVAGNGSDGTAASTISDTVSTVGITR